MGNARRVSRRLRVQGTRAARIWIAGMVAGLALACGGEKETTPSAAEPATPAAPSAQKPDAAELATLEGFYEWDLSAGGEPRDLKADVAECRSLSTATDLAGLREHADCMQARGWKVIQPKP